jgi:hypothetical protein
VHVVLDVLTQQLFIASINEHLTFVKMANRIETVSKPYQIKRLRMEPPASLAVLLRQHMERVRYTVDRLAKESTVPKPTIVNWLKERTKKPRDWKPVLLVAAALHLNEYDTTTLLHVGGHASLNQLRSDIQATVTSSKGRERTLLERWIQVDAKEIVTTPEDTWIHEVEGALKCYHRADELAHHAIQYWPAVRERITSHTPLVEAARQVLRSAIAKYAKQHPNNALLVREHYLHDASRTFHTLEREDAPVTQDRQHTQGLHEVALILAEYNRQAERQARLQRFTIRHTVVGTEPLVARVVTRLRDRNAPPIVVLEGMGGLGKTTLAKLIAQHFVHDDTFVRVLWASAQQVQWDQWNGRQHVLHEQAVDPAGIVRQLAHELALDVQGDLHMLQTEVMAQCARRPYLVIIDNLETVADVAALAPFIGALAGASRVLITTRERTARALPADLPRQYVLLNELNAATSLQLLRSAAHYTGATAITTATDMELHRIYAVTGGNPLALWLVAGQAVHVPLDMFLNDLVSRCPPGSTGDELYTFLYRRSWEQLSADAQLVLFAMHRCEAGADYALLRVLSGLQEAVFVRAVEELCRRMLLWFDGTTYTIHRLTYTFLRAVIMGWQ